MKKFRLAGCGALIAVGAVLLQTLPVLAAGTASPAAAGPPEFGRGFDWIDHTQQTLDELKVKLNLAPKQVAAWDAWSAGVMKDARQQIDDRKAWMEEKGARAGPPADDTTPERMARWIEFLRAQTNWMQQHLAQLEAAQVRTKTFYDALEPNQKTIFDLFWHEMHHRSAGHDEGWGMQGHWGYGPGPMMEERGGPGGGY
jgi:hypothetical protein